VIRRLGLYCGPFSKRRKKRLAARTISAFLNQNVQYDPELIHRTPEVMQYASNADEHLIQDARCPRAVVAADVGAWQTQRRPNFELLAPLLRHDGDAGLVRTIWCLTSRLGLTDAEEDTLVSFSQTLTDGYMPQHQK
jgi:hypothetical protein